MPWAGSALLAADIHYLPTAASPAFQVPGIRIDVPYIPITTYPRSATQFPNTAVGYGDQVRPVPNNLAARLDREAR